METLSDLFSFVLHQDRTLVFGDLGRYPQIVFEALLAIPAIEVNVISPFYKFNSSESRIRVLKKGEEVEKCDLLIYLEPEGRIEKHPLATRAVVFSSHYAFESGWVRVCFFSHRDAEGVRQLKELEDFPIRTENVDLVKANHLNVEVIDGKSRIAQADTYVIVNLTQFQRETLPMYLTYLDAFDSLLEADVYRFVVCFSENGHKAFKQFTQRIIDALLCEKIEYGNVTSIRELFNLLPFYKSHTIDRNVHFQVSSFGGIPFVQPKTQEEACAVAIRYDVRPIVQNVFWIVS